MVRPPKHRPCHRRRSASFRAFLGNAPEMRPLRAREFCAPLAGLHFAKQRRVEHRILHDPTRATARDDSGWSSIVRELAPLHFASLQIAGCKVLVGHPLAKHGVHATTNSSRERHAHCSSCRRLPVGETKDANGDVAANVRARCRSTWRRRMCRSRTCRWCTKRCTSGFDGHGCSFDCARETSCQ